MSTYTAMCALAVSQDPLTATQAEAYLRPGESCAAWYERLRESAASGTSMQPSGFDIQTELVKLASAGPYQVYYGFSCADDERGSDNSGQGSQNVAQTPPLNEGAGTSLDGKSIPMTPSASSHGYITGAADVTTGSIPRSMQSSPHSMQPSTAFTTAAEEDLNTKLSNGEVALPSAKGTH